MAAPANPVSWGAKEHKILSWNKYDTEVLVGTDQNLKPWTLLTKSGEFYVAAGVNDEIDAVCKSTKIQEGANTTSNKILVRTVEPWDTYVMDFDGTITEADIHDYFNITADQDVDESTGTGTAAATLAVQLLEVISTTKGVVRFVNQTV